MREFLHKRADFADLLRIVAERDGITPTLVEKDYWIMHCLWGLKSQGFKFELKGGTSLSKGFGIIKRFSEDIDIRFEPPAAMDVKRGKNHDKPDHIESRCDRLLNPGRISSRLRPIPGECANLSKPVNSRSTKRLAASGLSSPIYASIPSRSSSASGEMNRLFTSLPYSF